jgi:7,8-dihydropterin-6-yl-methyl-4-(beta-D-ribofuranosyl)aminobenzene 5'-phosphate synthase
MIIKTLVENTSRSEDLGSEHGLSIYIEARDRKILFDVGASGLFYENAQKMNVDISDIDFLIISHGHQDHGGGLRAFLQANTKAEVFLHRLAFEKYYADRATDERAFIGLEEELKHERQILPTSDRFFISEGIQVFSNIPQMKPCLASNDGLLMEQDGQTVADSFAHEQNLVIREDGKTLLATGCAHNGIVNTLEHFYALRGRMPDYVIGGFHLCSAGLGAHADTTTIDEIGKYLLGTKAKYYTCHCTGQKAYGQLKGMMGERIEYLHTGSEITI